MLINLTQYGLICAQGADAEQFLQGQLTCDVSKLTDGQSTLTAHCDPKGKMHSLFRLIRANGQQFYLLVNKSILTSTLEHLKKYAVFSNITFSQLDWQIVGIAGEDAVQQYDAISAQISLALPQQPTRYLLLQPAADNIEYDAPAEYWDVADIQAGIPLFSPPVQNQFIPQALNLQQLEQAISFTKGCYIGQETVARAKYRGANKRAMFTFRALTDSTPEIGEEIEMQLENGWRKTGFILSAVNFNGVLWLQAVLNNQTPPETAFRLAHDATRLSPYPLPYELTQN